MPAHARSHPLPSTPPRARPLAAADLPGLLQVQRACYGEGFEESHAVFLRRLASPAQCSLALERDGHLGAYLAAYRSLRGKVTPLHGDFEAAEAPDTLYLHDMAVAPALAGQGLAQVLLAEAWAAARSEGLRHSALVSVQGSQGYWARHGYAPAPLQDAAQRARLATYGEGAVYMVRDLPGD
ncbi:GNAT family N-acetyltransferase [Acidovorax sp. SUPP1855]|uniref:GNAT family N-acetyltransferase n=1 Tax=Acidovorax sp. SUPP1855 TaxID=431774 RepID=UPI0023DE6717|nr:GNAT family N-acetyltransferase [Acidovorax sp. SUPP1855]GKS86326.1 GNAT family N-acetyltransferase [Acidovorax sp. SUPP1855]